MTISGDRGTRTWVLNLIFGEIIFGMFEKRFSLRLEAGNKLFSHRVKE